MLSARKLTCQIVNLNTSFKKLVYQFCKYNQENCIRTYTTKIEDESVEEVLDVEEERKRFEVEVPNLQESRFSGLNLNRSEHNVFEIEDLIDVLNKENAEDVFVCSVPKALKYVDYLVTCSGRNYRHTLAIAEFVRRMFKIKRHSSDILPHIEGKTSRDWMALDLGNIALHIMSSEIREKYDLESLWSIGVEYDFEFNKPKDALVELFDRQLLALNQMQDNNTQHDQNIHNIESFESVNSIDK